MHKTTARHHHRNSHSHYDLYGDLAKIKAALSNATDGAKGRASELFLESLENVKDKSAAIQDNVSSYVAHKPIKSIGFALLTGVLLGFLIRK